MHNGVKKPGRNRSRAVRYCSDDYYIRIACAIVHSGIVNEDYEFLTSDWCAWLLDALDIGMSGLELLLAYKERTGGDTNGKR